MENKIALIDEIILEKLSKLDFGKFIQFKGITLAELGHLKNIVTNRVQSIRKPLFNCIPYDREMSIFEGKTSIVGGYVPDLSVLDDVREVEGFYNAFNQFATKVMEAYKLINSTIVDNQFFAIEEAAELQLLQNEINVLYDRIDAFNDERDELSSQINNIISNYANERDDEIITAVSFDVYLANNGSLAKYLVANQNAIALGNLILADGSRSNQPRNFLYRCFNVNSSVFVENNTIYTPVKNINLEDYHAEFYKVQKEHRDFEKEINHYKSQYQDYLNDVESINAATSIRYDKLFASKTKKLKTERDSYETNASKLIDEKNVLVQDHTIKQSLTVSLNRVEIQRRVKLLKVWIPEEFRVILELK